MPEPYANELDPSYFRSDPYERYAQRWNETGFSVGMFLLGAGIGFAAAMLFAPKSGAELRSQLSDSGRDVFVRVRGFADDLRKQFSRVVPEKTQQKVADVFDQARSRAEDLAGQVKQTVSSLADREKQGSSGRDIADLLNTISKDDLIAVKGVGPTIADRIIRNRPYRSERELIDKEVIQRNVFDVLKRELLNKVA